MSKPSLRKAINDHCKGCIYDPQSGLGSWRKQVELCTVTTCPLFPVRPISASGKPPNSGQQPKALRVYHENKRAQGDL